MTSGVSRSARSHSFRPYRSFGAIVFCFDSTCHTYFGTVRLLKVGGRGIYTDYVIVSKDTSLGIADLYFLVSPCQINELSLRFARLFHKILGLITMCDVNLNIHLIIYFTKKK